MKYEHKRYCFLTVFWISKRFQIFKNTFKNTKRNVSTNPYIVPQANIINRNITQLGLENINFTPFMVSESLGSPISCKHLKFNFKLAELFGVARDIK